MVLAWPLVGVVGGSAFAAEDPSPLVEPERREGGVFVPTKAEKLDALFETLGDADDPDSAEEAERAILNLWMESGSDTVDLLMTWSLAAMHADFHARALDFLDRVVLMQPDYAEGWNKRATVHFLMEDYGRSIADIGQVLEIEPRHFGALSGLGMMLRALGEEERAITAFRAALAVNPHLEDVRDALDELETAKVGQSL
ncbi:MAG: hypothetical protein GY798_00360 [Hyphomicrobiales bacterium]|nr:hypothetical protein [Hyphomicrobiales bacterium]